MRTQKSFLVLLSVFALSMFGCGGGSGAAIATPGCEGPDALCVTSCSLGCRATGCSITNIAKNQTLVFQFNREIDPGTVNQNSFRLRTAQGAAPVGSYFVQSNVVMFIPEVRTIGGDTFFGFESDKQYKLMIASPKDSIDVIRSKSGDTLAVSFECTLAVTRGIVDFDGKAPTAELLVPTSRTNVSPETQILVEFSELIDTSTIQSSSSAIVFEIGNTTNNGCGQGSQELPGSILLAVNQRLQRTQVIFEPAGRLPGDKCIFIRITDQIKDLSGKRAEPVTFSFVTERGVVQEKKIVEDFADAGQRDSLRNGATWEVGKVGPTLAGGSGELGDFDITAGGLDTGLNDARGRRIWTWDTENTVVPNYKTLLRENIKVEDGVYEFTSFVLDDDKHLRFIGKHIPIVRVTGTVDIRGTVSVSGTDCVAPKSQSERTPQVGQAGFTGGPGGGNGGKGGDWHTQSVDINGSNGTMPTLPPGHPLAGSAAGTAGTGSQSNPAVRNQKVKGNLEISPGFFMVQHVPAAGSSGGSRTAAKPGSFAKNTSIYVKTIKPEEMGPIPDAGKAYEKFDDLHTNAKPSSEKYVFGGGGGGGAGSNQAGTFDPPAPVVWNSGSGGAGGGGGLLMRCGGDFLLGKSGFVLANGGSSALAVGAVAGYYPAPGGAGGAGGILVQCTGDLVLSGSIRALGGKGNRLDANGGIGSLGQGFCGIDVFSGDGGNGFVRIEGLEVPSLGVLQTTIDIGDTVTTNNGGVFLPNDRDDLSVAVSNWYDTVEIFPPKYTKYEIETLIDNVAKTFSDKPGGTKADDSQAISFLVQGALLDANTNLPKPGTETKWSVGTVDGLNENPGNIFRWMIRFNSSKASSIQVLKVTVFYES